MHPDLIQFRSSIRQQGGFVVSEDRTIRPLIETQGLTKYFNEFPAVDGLDLQVYPGEIVALLGPNGAGKTTTIRLLASILEPSSGWACIDGLDVSEYPGEVRSRMGILTEHQGLYTRMRPMEYLHFFGEAYGLSPEYTHIRALELINAFDLEDTLERQRLGEYSKGMRQKLALARTLLHDPRIILLDEPTSALDPAGARKVRESVRHLRSSDRAIIICTHNLAEAEFLADRIVIMSRGRIVSGGTLQELRLALQGIPLMELRFRGDREEAVGIIGKSAQTVSVVEDRIQFRTSDPDMVAPHLVEQLIQAGVDVLSLSEITRSLEDVYLQIVNGKTVSGQGGRP